MVLPNRAATTGATARPMRVEPVAETTATRPSAASAAPISGPPTRQAASPSGASPNARTARANTAITASAVSGVFSDGFQITGLPHTSASAAFHAHTATGKLNAVITAVIPAGCQVSIIRWPGRSDAIVSPCNCRDRPTAKSQMSIISCTSPIASAGIFPASSVTSVARSSFAARSSSPRRRTSSPRRGAGTLRQVAKAAAARAMASSTLAGASGVRCVSTSPDRGVRQASVPAVPAEGMENRARVAEASGIRLMRRV
jgi:hypothetical protein